jgi:hypothetical protein
MPKGCRPLAVRLPAGCRPLAGSLPAGCRPLAGSLPAGAGRLPGNKNCILCTIELQSLWGTRGASHSWGAGGAEYKQVNAHQCTMSISCSICCIHLKTEKNHKSFKCIYSCHVPHEDLLPNQHGLVLVGTAEPTRN